MMYYHREHIVTRGCNQTGNQFDSVNDDDLAVLAQRGDGAAYNELCRRFFDYKKVNEKSGYYESSDLFQEGMFGFMNAVNCFSPERGVPFMAYAAICVNNRIKTVKTKTNGGGYIPVAGQDGEPDTVNTVMGPSELLESSESIERIWRLCERELSATEKAVLLCKVDGLSVAETGKKLGISHKSAENALMRARKKLRELL